MTYAGFKRRRLLATRKRESAKSLRFSRQRAFDSDTKPVMVTSLHLQIRQAGHDGLNDQKRQRRRPK